MSKYIRNIKKDDNVLTFKIDNSQDKFTTPLINAIRRTILSQIPNYSIDSDTVNFEVNTSMLHNEFLKHRLILLPVKYDEVDKLNFKNIKISYDGENKTEVMKNIYLRDFIVTYNEKKIDVNKIFSHTDILFSKLNKGQKLNFTCYLKDGTVLTEGDGAQLTNVSCCVHYFTEDKDGEYKKNNVGNPLEYNIKIEIENDMDPMKIFKMGLKILFKKLVELKTKINIEKADVNFLAYDFIDDDCIDCHALGGTITSYMANNIKYKFAGYDEASPLEKKLIIRTALKSNNTIDENKKHFIKSIDNILKTIKTLFK